MKRVLEIVMLACCLAGFSRSIRAGEPLSYDPARQALAVDPYFDGWGGEIEIDFDADHTWASIVSQKVWYYLDGYLTLPGVRSVTEIGGVVTVTRYGWGESMGSFAPVLNYSSFVETLYNGQSALDKFHYFTDEWNVAAGKTTLYVRPVAAVAGVDVPVQWSDLENIYFRVDSGAWMKFSDVYEPPALATGILITPDTLNLKSRGKWITVYITPSEGYNASDIDIATVRLSVQTVETVTGWPEEELLYTAGPSEILVDNSGTELMVKFDRSRVSSLLSPGQATLDVSGTFTDNRTFRGSDSFRVK